MSGERPLPFLDTSTLLYAFSADDRRTRAEALVCEPFATGVQALNEFAAVARRKLDKEWPAVRTALDDIRLLAKRIIAIDVTIHEAALDIAEGYKLSFYDSCMLAAALQSGCTRFYSEDLQHGLIVERQLVIVNPFR